MSEPLIGPLSINVWSEDGRHWFWENPNKKTRGGPFNTLRNCLWNFYTQVTGEEL